MTAETSPAIHALHVGLPQTLGDPSRQPWRSGIVKAPVAGPVHLGETNLDGDGQADLRHHGGPEKAVCVYPLAHYPYWTERLGLALGPGDFGENATIAGQDEASVCIGDVFVVGEALVQVSQPRSPCWKLARRWDRKKLALWVQETGYTGWYLRVLRTGRVEAGLAVVLGERPHPEWTIQRVNQLRYRQVDDREAARQLAACQALSEGWRERFRRLAAGQSHDEAARLTGTPRTP